MTPPEVVFLFEGHAQDAIYEDLVTARARLAIAERDNRRLLRLLEQARKLRRKIEDVFRKELRA